MVGHFLILFTGFLTFTGPIAEVSEVLILTGVYSGMNLYVQNPMLPDNHFSTEEVFVNQELVLSHPMTSAYTIDLSHLLINQAVEIKIVHKKGPKPRVINAHVLQGHSFGTTSYAPVEHIFRWINVDGTTLRWLTHGEKGEGTFEVQRADSESWILVKSIPAKTSGESGSVYRVEITHQSGLNSYRIKLTDRDGFVTYSDPIKYVIK